MKLRFDTKYINTNPKCNKISKAFGFVPHIDKQTAYSKGVKATINKDGTYDAIIYLDSYLPGFCKYKPLYTEAVFNDGTSNDYYSGAITVGSVDKNSIQVNTSNSHYSGATVARFVNKKTPRHSIQVNCDSLKNQYEWAKKENVPGFNCRLKEDKYLINPHKIDDLFDSQSEEYLELQAFAGWKYNEISINQNDIEVNFNFKGDKQ